MLRCVREFLDLRTESIDKINKNVHIATPSSLEKT